ncbi:hypothetical protein EJ04DRAFT_550335 [Polyplosphaeria fusca]|uniref:Uncharacterized protein n=1 Tax=Polyplosphaeria fusca TaxID=682080 RepID=A0A9P4R340_9PLEO|nr:hypothetical protein EJ04DRAFT_550335 [Polyplosphaeria fusca]
MARRHVPTTLAIIVLWSLSFGCCRATPKCFFPNGDSSPSDHAPCDSNAGASVCCSTGFECTSNGLCVDPRYSNFQRVLRGGCTDESWGGDCPAFCKDRYPEGDAAVYYCGDGKYCCDSQDCCNDNNASVLTLGAPKVTAIAGEAGVQASELAQAPTVQPGTPSQQASSAQGGTSHAVTRQPAHPPL